MEINQVGKDKEGVDTGHEMCGNNDNSVLQQLSMMLNELTKGKGKRKGCWNCGQEGHIAAQCPNGKGKGKRLLECMINNYKNM